MCEEDKTLGFSNSLAQKNDKKKLHNLAAKAGCYTALIFTRLVYFFLFFLESVATALTLLSVRGNPGLI